MSGVFALPDLGEGLTEAEIVQWHVAVGDEVQVDQEVVTVETAKAAVAVPCPFAGTVQTLHGEEGQTLEVGSPLITVAMLGATGDNLAEAGGEQYRQEERAGAQPPRQADPDAQGNSGGQGSLDAQVSSKAQGSSDGAPERPLIGYGAGDGPARRTRTSRRRRAADAAPVSHAAEAASTAANSSAANPAEAAPTRTGAIKVISPLVRRLAAEAGLDLTEVTPTGPAGVIRRADVESALANGSDAIATTAATTTPGSTAAASTGTDRAGADTTRIPLTGMRRAIAEKLSTSRREIPDATTWVDVDATGLLELRDVLRRTRPEAGIGLLALLARITVAGLRRHPELNARVDTAASEIVQHHSIHLGFAAQSPRGLVVPVVHHAEQLSTAELAARLRELTDGAREGTLTPADLTGGTATLNNYGVFGVDGSTPILNHPEAAMLGVGRIVDKPWAHQGQLALRKVTQLSFTFDHRVCDGGTAGGFLRYMADCVEEPASVLADL